MSRNHFVITFYHVYEVIPPSQILNSNAQIILNKTKSHLFYSDIRFTDVRTSH